MLEWWKYCHQDTILVQWTGARGHSKIGGWQLDVWDSWQTVWLMVSHIVLVHLARFTEKWDEIKAFSGGQLHTYTNISPLPVIKFKSSVMTSYRIAATINQSKRESWQLFITSCTSEHLFLFCILLSGIDVGVVGSLGIISLLNCYPMSAKMPLNIRIELIMFLSVFSLFPLWAWLSRSLCWTHLAHCYRQCTGPLMWSHVTSAGTCCDLQWWQYWNRAV